MAFHEDNPAGVSQAEMVVAIPTFNEADAIAHTTEQVDRALREFFGSLSSVIINCDNHSTDGTREAFFSAPGTVPRIHISTDAGVRGKGNNLKNLFEKVSELGARIVVVVEADIKNLAPYWIRNLAEPIARGAGFSCPIYVRHKYEATLTTSVLYPLLRCLYGRRIRQPNVGDFGFRGDLAKQFLETPLWTESVENYGIDIWMTTVALNARLPITQSVIGAPKVHRVKDPYTQLALQFQQIVGTIFDLMNHYADFWRQVRWSKPTALFGADIQDIETPIAVEVNATRLHGGFLQGFESYSGVWQDVFGQTVCHKLQEIGGLGLQHFSFPTQTWASILFDAAAAYHRMNPEERSRLLNSLLPLYFGKVLSFVKKTERMSLQQSEEYVETECTVFEENKPSLVRAWQ